VIDTAKYGPWALVAGGSEGVGAEFAQLLAEAGLNLVLVARKPDPLQHTAERCRRHGGEVRTVQADLSAPDASESIAAATSGLEVGLLILVAGANTHSLTSRPRRERRGRHAVARSCRSRRNVRLRCAGRVVSVTSTAPPAVTT
jgi:short-subunit dehydrogenase